MALMSRFSFIFGILALITFARLGHSLPCVRIDDPASAPTSAGVPQPALSSPFPFKASVEKEMSTAWSCPVSETEVGTVAVDVACSVGSTAACRLAVDGVQHGMLTGSDTALLVFHSESIALDGTFIFSFTSSSHTASLSLEEHGDTKQRQLAVAPSPSATPSRSFSGTRSLTSSFTASKTAHKTFSVSLSRSISITRGASPSSSTTESPSSAASASPSSGASASPSASASDTMTPSPSHKHVGNVNPAVILGAVAGALIGCVAVGAIVYYTLVKGRKARKPAVKDTRPPAPTSGSVPNGKSVGARTLVDGGVMARPTEEKAMLLAGHNRDDVETPKQRKTSGLPSDIGQQIATTLRLLDGTAEDDGDEDDDESVNGDPNPKRRSLSPLQGERRSVSPGPRQPWRSLSRQQEKMKKSLSPPSRRQSGSKQQSSRHHSVVSESPSPDHHSRRRAALSESPSAEHDSRRKHRHTEPSKSSRNQSATASVADMRSERRKMAKLIDGFKQYLSASVHTVSRGRSASRRDGTHSESESVLSVSTPNGGAGDSGRGQSLAPMTPRHGSPHQHRLQPRAHSAGPVRVSHTLHHRSTPSAFIVPLPKSATQTLNFNHNPRGKPETPKWLRRLTRSQQSPRFPRRSAMPELSSGSTDTSPQPSGDVRIVKEVVVQPVVYTVPSTPSGQMWPQMTQSTQLPPVQPPLHSFPQTSVPSMSYQPYPSFQGPSLQSAALQQYLAQDGQHHQPDGDTLVRTAPPIMMQGPPPSALVPHPSQQTPQWFAPTAPYASQPTVGGYSWPAPTMMPRPTLRGNRPVSPLFF